MWFSHLDHGLDLNPDPNPDIHYDISVDETIYRLQALFTTPEQPHLFARSTKCPSKFDPIDCLSC